MKSIHDSDTEERLKRALLAIEMISCFETRTDDDVMSKIFCIAHSSLKHCPHPDWLEIIERTEKEMANSNSYHVEKCLQKIP